MFSVSNRGYETLPGFKRTYQRHKMTLGLFFPIEAFTGDTPSMANQVQLAQQAEAAGFAALWFRDVPLRDPSFGDVGQIFDPWTYLGYIAAQTTDIALGTGAIVVPIRHPLHLAKAASSIDRLSGGRFLLGVASGDRPVEFPAFGVDPETRGERFRESLQVMREALGSSFKPVTWSGGVLADADLVPKPIAADIPLFITGSSRQSIDWIAQNSHGWITYPRRVEIQQRFVKGWQEAVQAAGGGDVFKPFSQSLFIDLLDDPTAAPQPIHLGYRLGRNALMSLLQSHEAIGVNHIMLNLKYGRREAGDVIAELAEYVLPHFPCHGQDS